MDEELEGQEPEQQEEEAAPEQEAASVVDTSQYMTKAEAAALAEEAVERVLSRYQQQPQQARQEEEEVPNPQYDPEGYAKYLQESVTKSVVGTLRQEREAEKQANQAKGLIASALGGEANLEAAIKDGYSLDDLYYVAQNPARAARFRRSFGEEPVRGKSAPRSEGVGPSDSGAIPGDLQREIDRAYPAYKDAFNVSKSDFTKMVLQKRKEAYN